MKGRAVPASHVLLKRVPAALDGTQILVDRLWPRGISKARAALDSWDPEGWRETPHAGKPHGDHIGADDVARALLESG